MKRKMKLEQKNGWENKQTVAEGQFGAVYTTI